MKWRLHLSTCFSFSCYAVSSCLPSIAAIISVRPDWIILLYLIRFSCFPDQIHPSTLENSSFQFFHPKEWLYNFDDIICGSEEKCLLLIVLILLDQIFLDQHQRNVIPLNHTEIPNFGNVVDLDQNIRQQKYF